MGDFDFGSRVVAAFHAGQQQRMAKEKMAKDEEESKLRQDLLKHQLNTEKLNQQINARNFAQQTALQRPQEVAQFADQGGAQPEATAQANGPALIASPTSGQLAPREIPTAPAQLPGVTDPESGAQLAAPGVETRTVADMLRMQAQQRMAEEVAKAHILPEGGKLIIGGQAVASSAPKPIALRPGGSLINPQTGQPIATSPAAEKTDEFSTYMHAIQQKKGAALTPEETLAAVHGYAQAKSDPEIRALMIQSKNIAAQNASAAGEARDTARSDKSYQFHIAQLNTLQKPIDDGVLRLQRLQTTMDQGSPQADALVAPELLTVMAGGQGSGLRMNEAEIARIVGGRSKWEDLKANLNKWRLDPNAARSITPSQDAQIRQLVGEVQTRLNSRQQVLEQAREQLAGSTDPMQHRQILAGVRSHLNSAGSNQQGQGGIAVQAPDGTTYHFLTQQQANDFKAKAHIQ